MAQLVGVLACALESRGFLARAHVQVSCFIPGGAERYLVDVSPSLSHFSLPIPILSLKPVKILFKKSSVDTIIKCLSHTFGKSLVIIYSNNLIKT